MCYSSRVRITQIFGLTNIISIYGANIETARRDKEKRVKERNDFNATATHA